MLRELINPLISGEDMVADFFTGLLFESCIRLGHDHMLKEAWIDGSNDIYEELTGWSLGGSELLVHILLHLLVILDLFNQIVHG